MANGIDDRVEVYIGLGANLGDRRRSVRRGADAIDRLDATRVVNISDLYETPARFVEDQPDFINACVGARTSLGAQHLLEKLLEIEQRMGRVRGAEHVEKGPRVIDLDILFYGHQVIDKPGLTIPHPDLHNRRFVLRPLLDIAPQLVHPILEKTVRQLFDGL